MHRRVFTVLLIATLLIGSVFAGGGKESAASSADDNKLVVAIQTHSMVSDYDDNYLTKYIEDLTGIDIEFYELPPAKADVRTNVSLLAASSDDLPDVLLTDALTPETILSYGESGVFVPLDDYVDNAELLPNFNAIPEEDRSVMLETMTMANGHMYSFVRFEPEIWNYTPYRTFINGAWLDKLGLEVPTTTDELKEVLIAFRDNDPNGNGIQDELGVYGYQGKYGQNTIASIMNAFVYYNDQIFNYGLDLAPDGKTVYAPFTSDGWREGLKYMNDIYNEGVLAPSIFTDADSQFKARLNETDNVVGLVSAGSLSPTGLMQQTIRTSLRWSLFHHSQDRKASATQCTISSGHHRLRSSSMVLIRLSSRSSSSMHSMRLIHQSSLAMVRRMSIGQGILNS